MVRLLVALFVCSGFGLYMAQPAQAKQSSQAFAEWFSLMAKTTDAPMLQKKLQDLKTSGAQLDEMLEQASRIVTDNNEEFNFPFSKKKASHDLYQLLLIEWNQFQTGNAMAGIPVAHQTMKPLLVHVDKIAHLEAAVAGKIDVTSGVQARLIPYRPLPVMVSAIMPMSSGIAIGAP